MTILISPFSKPLKNGKMNPKNYPWWMELIGMLKANGHRTIQIGVEGEISLCCDEEYFDLPLRDIKQLLDRCDTWIAVDNFFPHFGYTYNRPGIVLFSKSDPNIFGHKENLNILKDRKYLRVRQFEFWHEEEYLAEAFEEPKTILVCLENSKSYLTRRNSNA